MYAGCGQECSTGSRSPAATPGSCSARTPTSRMSTAHLTIGMVNAGARDSFTRSGADEILRQALIDELGVDWRVEAIVDADRGRCDGGERPRTRRPVRHSDTGSGERSRASTAVTPEVDQRHGDRSVHRRSTSRRRPRRAAVQRGNEVGSGVAEPRTVGSHAPRPKPRRRPSDRARERQACYRAGRRRV